jgi:mRNA interferase RelE/StbE
MYEIRFTAAANRELRRLPAQVIRRVVAAIDQLARDPRPHGAKKLAGSQDTYRLRVGDYRVVYIVDDDQQVILITRIRHRKDTYK